MMRTVYGVKNKEIISWIPSGAPPKRSRFSNSFKKCNHIFIKFAPTQCNIEIGKSTVNWQNVNCANGEGEKTLVLKTVAPLQFLKIWWQQPILSANVIDLIPLWFSFLSCTIVTYWGRLELEIASRKVLQSKSSQYWPRVIGAIFSFVSDYLSITTFHTLKGRQKSCDQLKVFKSCFVSSTGYGIQRLH